MTLMFGDYSSGGTISSADYAIKAYGNMGEQHAVPSVAGGNENNVIETKQVSCQSGGKRTRRKRGGLRKRKSSKKSHKKRVHGGKKTRSHRKRM